MTHSLRCPRRRFVALAAAQLVVPAIVRAQGAPTIELHKSPSCGCCGGWADHMERAGFPVERREIEDLDPIKARAGVPESLLSCHTAFLDGYALEGHVPVAAIRRLLVERPRARGLAVPGMPIGSPGMEAGGRREPYTVWLFADRQRPTAFMHIE